MASSGIILNSLPCWCRHMGVMGEVGCICEQGGGGQGGSCLFIVCGVSHHLDVCREGRVFGIC